MEKPEAKEKHRRYSADEQAAIVARYKQSNQTQVAFCAQAGIAVPTLIAWCRRTRASAHRSRSPSLLEVKLPLALASSVTLEINGCTIRMSPGTSVEWLGSLIQKLRA
jgi:transposase-like protein